MHFNNKQHKKSQFLFLFSSGVLVYLETGYVRVTVSVKTAIDRVTVSPVDAFREHQDDDQALQQ